MWYIIICRQHPPSKSHDQVFTWLLKAWFCTCNLRNLFLIPRFPCITFWSAPHTLALLSSSLNLLFFSLHSPASASGCFLELIYLQERKPLSVIFLQPRLGDNLQVFHLLGDLFSKDLVSQSLSICHLYNNGCDPWGRGNVFGEKLLDSVLEAELGWLPLGETTGLSSGSRVGLITTRGKGAMGLVKKLLNVSKHIFIKSYSLRLKGQRQDNFIDL